MGPTQCPFNQEVNDKWLRKARAVKEKAADAANKVAKIETLWQSMSEGFY